MARTEIRKRIDNNGRLWFERWSRAAARWIRIGEDETIVLVSTGRAFWSVCEVAPHRRSRHEASRT
jgi:hypothetical protein